MCVCVCGEGLGCGEFNLGFLTLMWCLPASPALLMHCSVAQVHTDEPFNEGFNIERMKELGVMQLKKNGPEFFQIQMSKVLLQVLFAQERECYVDSSDNDNLVFLHPRESSYVMPAEILRTFREYHGDIQELAHVWSLIYQFNALVSLTVPAPRVLTMAALRPGAVLLEEEEEEEGDASLLTREMHRGPRDWLRCVSNKIENDKRVLDGRVALHDVPDQPAFTAGLTIASTKGIDGWVRVQLKPKQERGESERGESERGESERGESERGESERGKIEDAVILLQTKGKQMRNVQFWGGDDRTLPLEVIQSFVQSLMLSGYQAVDQHVLAILEKYQKNEVSPKMLVRACVFIGLCGNLVLLNARFVHCSHCLMLLVLCGAAGGCHEQVGAVEQDARHGRAAARAEGDAADHRNAQSRVPHHRGQLQIGAASCVQGPAAEAADGASRWRCEACRGTGEFDGAAEDPHEKGCSHSRAARAGDPSGQL